MFFAQVYLQLPAELYMTLRAVGSGACRALPSFTMSLGICLARIRRVRQMVDSWEVWQDEFEVQRELASLLVALGVQCELLPSDSPEVENVKMHWSVFDEVAVWSPWASTRREAISLIWQTQGTNESVRALWRRRHGVALGRVDSDSFIRSCREQMEDWEFMSMDLCVYLALSPGMEQHRDGFHRAVLYGDQAILCGDTKWFDAEYIGDRTDVGRTFQLSGGMAESMVNVVNRHFPQLARVLEY